jgi:hypothetical protein
MARFDLVRVTGGGLHVTAHAQIDSAAHAHDCQRAED